MGFWSLTAASLGGVIGSGWLFGEMFAAQAAGPEAVVAWIVGGIALALIALVFSELSRVKPESGALVRYPKYTHGAFVASMVGWGLWLGYAANPPTEASGIVQYLSRFSHGLYNGKHLTGSGLMVAILIMIVFVLVNYFGVHIFARSNLIVTILKFVVPGITLVALFATGFHSNNFTYYGGFAPYGWSAGLSAIATSGIIFAYTGFRAAIDMGGEAKNPSRDIPRAVISAIGIAMVLYIGLQLAFVGAVPVRILGHGWHGVNLNSPFADLALSINLTWLYWMIIADSMISPAGSSFVYVASNSRVVFGLAKNRFFPSYFAKINQKYGVPTRALLLNFIVGLLYLLPLKSWHSIIAITGAMGLYTYSVGAASVMVFRGIGLTKDTMKIKGMAVIAPLGFVISTLIVYWAGWSILQKTIPLLLAGVILSAVSFWFNRYKSKEFSGGVWMIAYLLAIFALSKLGSFDGLKVIPAPLDSVIVALMALVIYYWAVSSGLRYMGTEENAQRIIGLNSSEQPVENVTHV